MTFCRVSGCNFVESHVTISHVCGTCGETGHGQIECGSSNAIEDLKQYYPDRLPKNLWCTIPNCINKQKHQSSAHHCIKCKRRHAEEDCLIQLFEHQCEKYGFTYNRFDVTQFTNDHINDQIVVPINMGMGCLFYVRYKDNLVESLFMHSDNWGQYSSVNDEPIYQEFIKGCTILPMDSYIIEPKTHVKCPICRTNNSIENIKDVKGAEEKCKICLTNSVEKFFIECGHMVACNYCFKQLT